MSWKVLITARTLDVVGSGDDAFDAFVPSPLPQHPPLKLTAKDHDLLERANRALRRLDGLTVSDPVDPRESRPASGCQEVARGAVTG
jgi:hypothetical protein